MLYKNMPTSSRSNMHVEMLAMFTKIWRRANDRVPVMEENELIADIQPLYDEAMRIQKLNDQPSNVDHSLAPGVIRSEYRAAAILPQAQIEGQEHPFFVAKEWPCHFINPVNKTFHVGDALGALAKM